MHRGTTTRPTNRADAEQLIEQIQEKVIPELEESWSGVIFTVELMRGRDHHHYQALIANTFSDIYADTIQHYEEGFFVRLGWKNGPSISSVQFSCYQLGEQTCIYYDRIYSHRFIWRMIRQVCHQWSCDDLWRDHLHEIVVKDLEDGRGARIVKGADIPMPRRYNYQTLGHEVATTAHDYSYSEVWYAHWDYKEDIGEDR